MTTFLELKKRALLYVSKKPSYATKKDVALKLVEEAVEYAVAVGADQQTILNTVGKRLFTKPSEEAKFELADIQVALWQAAKLERIRMYDTLNEKLKVKLSRSGERK